ncbi:MAG: hypothetical protein GX225_07000 [Clostridiales bacterium]|nr:hypothetical protein [Clostridiales bacterium]
MNEEKKNREKFSDMAVVLAIKEPKSKAFYELYIEMVQFLYNLDGLYIILSKDYLDKTRGLSIPLGLTKEKFPAIYLFTDYELAAQWCKHYNYYLEDGTPPIGYLPKDQMEFLNVFQIAFQLGIYRCIINEGARLLCVNIADMIKVNNMGTQTMAMPIEEIEEMLKQGKQPKIMVRFNCVEIVDFKYIEEDIQYLRDIRDKIFDDYCKALEDMNLEIYCKGNTIRNAGEKFMTIFFEKNDDIGELLSSGAYSRIEKTFFELASAIDTRKLFDNRYSYIRLESKEKYPNIAEYFGE